MGCERRVLAAFVGMVLSCSAFGQGDPSSRDAQATPPPQIAKPPDPTPVPGGKPASEGGTFKRVPLLGDFVRDQKAILKSPLSLRFQDVVWLAPLAGVTTGLLLSDSVNLRHVNSS